MDTAQRTAASVAAPTKGALRVLVVEPKNEYASLIADLLRRIGGEMERVEPDEALDAALAGGITLALVDSEVLAPSGRSVLRELRERTTLPTIALSDPEGSDDSVRRAIEHADHELVRPFSPRRFSAAVRAVARRGRVARGLVSSAGTPDNVSLGPLQLDRGRLQARVDGARGSWVQLSSREFSLLHVLATHPGIVFTRDELAQRAWGWASAGDTRVVDNVIARLRRKLGDDAADPRLLLTDRGAGYRIAVP